MNMLLDYIVAKECKNREVFCTCCKCGKCGREFDKDGVMIDDGGTEPIDEEYLD